VWPQLRAGLIAITIFFGLVEGCPLPPRDDTPAWERGFVEAVRTVQQVVETPVAWIGPTLRVSQRWALYQHPGDDMFRMEIHGLAADGTWQLLYRAGDPDHAEDAAVLESGRVWGAWNPVVHPPGQYQAFCTWFALRAIARHPELAAVRVRQEHIHLVPGGIVPTGTYEFEATRFRGRR
jgi:hypothetical protein